MNDTNVNAWSGIERRNGRIVYSRGPIIRTLEFISALAGLAAIASLIFALSVFSDRLDLIQQSREYSATDTCYLFRSAIHAATPRGKEGPASAYLTRLGLDNCIVYGRNVTSLKHAGGK